MNRKLKKEQHLFEIKHLCHIINDFTVTFDQFNESLLNKSINFFQKTQTFEWLCKSVYFPMYALPHKHGNIWNILVSHRTNL